MKKFVLLLILPLLFLGCDDSKDGPGGGKVTPARSPKTRQVVQDLYAHVLTPTFVKFRTQVVNFKEQVHAGCALVPASSGNEQAAKLQTFWKEMMDTYHQMEMFKVGPLKERNGALAKRIYSWPDINACSVDVEISLMHERPGYKPREIESRVGLDAIEYLLFDNDLNHDCPAGGRTGGWNELPVSEREQYRCEYLKLVADHLVTQVNELDIGWRQYQTDTQGLSDEHLLNEIVVALFAIETEMRDFRVGVPTGLIGKVASCEGKYCPDMVEHRWSKLSVQALRSNLAGAKAILTGQIEGGDSSGLGLNTLLAEHPEPSVQNLAYKFGVAITQLEGRLNQLPADADLRSMIEGANYQDCQESTSTERKVEACALYKDIKVMTDLLKLELVTGLSLRLPLGAASDMD